MGCAGSKNEMPSNDESLSKEGQEKTKQNKVPSNDDANLLKQDKEESNASVSASDAQRHLEEKLELNEKRADKLVDMIKDESGNVPKRSLDKLTTDAQKAIEKISCDFKAADEKKSGVVSFDEAYAIISTYFPGLPESTRHAIIHNYDRDNNREVSFHELKEFYLVAYLKKEYIEKKFEELDADGNGVLDKDELVETLSEELCLMPLEAVCIVDDCDKNKDGVIDKAEFIHMWSNLFG